MTLANRLTIELQRFGLEKHPLGQTLPNIIEVYQRQYQRSRWLAICCVLLFGIIFGMAGALGVFWQRLDALDVRGAIMAAACLNPGKPVVTSKAAAQVAVTEIQKRKEVEP